MTLRDMGSPRWSVFTLKTRHLTDLLFALVVLVAWGLFEAGAMNFTGTRLAIVGAAAGIMVTTIWGTVADYIEERRNASQFNERQAAAVR